MHVTRMCTYVASLCLFIYISLAYHTVHMMSLHVYCKCAVSVSQELHVGHAMASVQDLYARVQDLNTSLRVHELNTICPSPIVLDARPCLHSVRLLA